MPTVVISDAAKAMTLTASDNTCNAECPSLIAFMQAAEELAEALPLVEILTKGDGKEFYYSWKLKDGQAWQQKVRIDGDTAWMTFDMIQGEWNDLKFPYRRDVWDTIKTLILNYGLTHLEYTRL